MMMLSIFGRRVVQRASVRAWTSSSRAHANASHRTITRPVAVTASACVVLASIAAGTCARTQDDGDVPFSVYAKCDMKILSGNTHPALAKDIANMLGVRLADSDVTKFKNGETRVTVRESVRDCDCFIVQPTCNPDPNDAIIELLIMVDTLKRAGAARITVVMPLYGYARQSYKSKSRTPITAKLVMDMLEQAGVTRVLTIDLHSSQIQGFTNLPIDNLDGLPLLRNYLLRLGIFGEDVVVCASTPSAAKKADMLARKLGAGFALNSSVRYHADDTDHAVLVGDVADKTCVLVGAMVDSGDTFCEGARVAKEAGAKTVIAAAVHGIFSDNAMEQIDASCIDLVLVTDTTPSIRRNRESSKVTVLSTAGLLAHAIWRIHMGGSLGQLFDYDSAAHIS